MKILRSSFIIVLCFSLCLVFLPSPSFATGEPLNIEDYQKLGAAITTLYGYYNNTSLAFDPEETGPALTVITNLYNETVTSNPELGADPALMAAIGTAIISGMSLAVVYDSVSGSPTLQLALDGNVVGALDSFFNGMLTELGLYRDPNSDLFQWLDDNPIEAYKLAENTFNGKPVHNLPLMIDKGDVGGSYIKYYIFTQNQGRVYYYIQGVSNKPNRRIVQFVSDQGFSVLQEVYYGNGSLQSSTINSASFNAVSGNASYSFMIDLTTNGVSPDIDTYDTIGTYIGNGATIISNNQAVFASPYFYVGDPLRYEPTIEIPNPLAPGYQPQPQRIQTDFEIDPENHPDVLPNNVPVPTPNYPYPIPTDDPDALRRLIDDLWDKIVTEIVSVDDPQPIPTPQPDPHPDPNPDPDPDPDPEDPNPDDPSNGIFHAPLLPFLPNFNFNLSSIWHYVVEWVSSLGSWFSLTFSIWRSLPYAMVVPVYATAVVVIVLGVYKRFFG